MKNLLFVILLGTFCLFTFYHAIADEIDKEPTRIIKEAIRDIDPVLGEKSLSKERKIEYICDIIIPLFNFGEMGKEVLPTMWSKLYKRKKLKKEFLSNFSGNIAEYLAKKIIFHCDAGETKVLLQKRSGDEIIVCLTEGNSKIEWVDIVFRKYDDRWLIYNVDMFFYGNLIFRYRIDYEDKLCEKTFDQFVELVNRKKL